MQKISVTHDSLPSAVGLLIDRTERLEALCNMLLEGQKGKGETFTTGGRRIVDAPALAKKFKIPLSTIYGKVHRGSITPLRMPNSRKLYFDLDQVEASMSEIINA